MFEPFPLNRYKINNIVTTYTPHLPQGKLLNKSKDKIRHHLG